MDPPRHSKVRDAFTRPFMAREIKHLEPMIASIVNDLLAPLEQGSEVEMVAEFAYPFPILVICSILGIPRDDYILFNQWSAKLSQALDTGSDPAIEAGIPASVAIRDYFMNFVGEQLKSPGDGLIGDMIKSGAISQLSIDEVLYGCAFLLWAGHETTKNLLVCSLISLCEYPEQAELLRRQPKLMVAAVEELLRFTSPVQKLSRWTKQDTTFSGYSIPAATLVTALIGSANHDPIKFENPDVLDLGRHPGGHLAFGLGPHYCLGSVLTRLETRVALAAILGKFSAIQLVDHKWRPNASLRSLDSLTLSLC